MNYKQFVQNRIDEILQITNPESWRFCPGTGNSADIGSRGQKVSELSEIVLWGKRPHWLTLGPSAYPKQGLLKDLTVDEIRDAENSWIREIQKDI